MTSASNSPVHWSFWVISGLALVWNLLGVVNFLVQLLATDLAGFPEWWRMVVETRPGWATVAMAIAVVCGAMGSALLLLRRRGALFLFAVSLLAVAATMSHAIGVGDPGPRQIAEGIVMPIAGGVFMIWYSWLVRRKGWIG